MTGEYWGEFNVQNVLSFRVPRTDLQLLDYDVTVLSPVFREFFPS